MDRTGLYLTGSHRTALRGIGLGLLAATLLAGGAYAQKSKDTGPGGVSCTYEKCMDNCIKVGGKVCTNYCEKTLKERRMSGVCKG